MNKIFLLILLLSSGLTSFAQVGRNVELRIIKAEDARRFDGELEALLRDRSPAVRRRAALAAGRIGDERAVDQLAALLADGDEEVRVMAAFALGEVESVKAADAVLAALKDTATPDAVRARLIEAAGKIVAANAGPPNTPRDQKVIALGDAVLDALEAEAAKGKDQSVEIVRLGLTAALRARAEGSDTVTSLFLTNLNPDIRADAGNTLTRLRAKNSNPALRAMLMNDDNPIARANAARALGAAEDKDAVNILIVAAVEDDDSRVRVSAIRSLAALRDPYAVERLLDHGEKLLSKYTTDGRGGRAGGKAVPISNPPEKNELLEIAAALGRLVPKTNDSRTIRFLTALGEADRYSSPETEIAFARVSPKKYTEYLTAKKAAFKNTPGAASAALQGIREMANLGGSEEEAELKRNAIDQLTRGLQRYDAGQVSPTAETVPEVLRTLAAFKPDGIDETLRRYLLDKDVFIRATAADLIGDRPANKQNFEALRSAFTRSLLTDKMENDAQLGILAAMFGLDRKGSVSTLLIALNAPDYLVRKSAFEKLGHKELKDVPEAAAGVANARKERRDQVLPYSASSGTKLGQMLNSDADYRRALSRRDGTVKAVFTTQKGIFTIDLLPEEAPLTVDNFVKLAKAGYFNGLTVHRVVPNFVMQDGDPRGDGNGGPGWSIRCEVNMVPYERGAVGMALSGKDTGGSQWFVTHSPQPHLDGGYTVFGKVNETGMKVVDKIVRGDRIISVRIVGR